MSDPFQNRTAGLKLNHQPERAYFHVRFSVANFDSKRANSVPQKRLGRWRNTGSKMGRYRGFDMAMESPQ